MFYTVFLFLFVASINRYPDVPCTKDGMQGYCVSMLRCKSALEDIINNMGPPELCYSRDDGVKMVCCLDNAQQSTERPPVATTSTPNTTPKSDNTAQSDDSCEPISSNLTSVRTGEKAWDKCIEYQQKLVYPCERGVAPINGTGRMNNCNHKDTQLINGGQEAGVAEFPHMVLLGNEKDNAIFWYCAGTLISERFILTAGHCTYMLWSTVKYARTGLLKQADDVDALHLYRISDVITHPEYKPTSQYNDIALLKTERDIFLDQFVVPACLDVGRPNNYQKALVTGWGTTVDSGEVDILRKYTLDKFTSTECSEFGNHDSLEFGVDENTQFCYGDRKGQKDFCVGERALTLQVYHEQIHCMHTVVGVSLFGNRCSRPSKPNIYTRVAPYVRWIESIVWP